MDRGSLLFGIQVLDDLLAGGEILHVFDQCNAAKRVKLVTAIIQGRNNITPAMVLRENGRTKAVLILFESSMERDRIFTKRFSMSLIVTASFFSFFGVSFTSSVIFFEGTEVRPVRQNSKSGIEQNLSV